MNAQRLRLCVALSIPVLSIGAASPALALANRVFVSARSGNNANACDNVITPCQTFAGAVTQLSPDGEVIVLDSGGYGQVTITQGVTIEAPAGVTAFVHPAITGNAITVNAALTDKVTLRGLTLNAGPSNGIIVNSVGTLNVENCFITGFAVNGILMLSPGRLNVKGTDITACSVGMRVSNTTGLAETSIDHCHFDSNNSFGFEVATTAPSSSTTTATYTTANNNNTGWLCGTGVGGGVDVLNLEFCSGSENGFAGLVNQSSNVSSRTRYSNCVFANNGTFGVEKSSIGILETRINNTITGNGSAEISGIIGPFPPL